MKSENMAIFHRGLPHSGVCYIIGERFFLNKEVIFPEPLIFLSAPVRTRTSASTEIRNTYLYIPAYFIFRISRQLIEAFQTVY